MKKILYIYFLSILLLASCSDNNPIINFKQAAKGTATDVEYLNYFALHAAVSGRVAVVSAHTDGGSGAIYIFENQGKSWLQTHKLTPADIDPLSEIKRFGVLLDIDKDIIVVKAEERYKEYKNQTTFSRKTIVYVIEKSGDIWVKTAKLSMPSDRFGINEFGCSLAVSNGNVVIGDSRATFDQEVIGGTRQMRASGAVYLFNKKGETWVQTAKLKPHNSEWNDCFGQAVAIDDNTLVVSRPAWRDKSLPRGISVFEQANGLWQEVNQFSMEHCSIGTEMAISRDTIVASGGNAVSVFQHRENRWDFVKTIKPPDKAANSFGTSIATNGKYIAVRSDFSSKGTAIYLYQKPYRNLVEDYKLTTFWGVERFGPLSIDGNTLLVGKPNRSQHPDKLLLKLINFFYKSAFYQQGEIYSIILPDEKA